MTAWSAPVGGSQSGQGVRGQEGTSPYNDDGAGDGSTAWSSLDALEWHGRCQISSWSAMALGVTRSISRRRQC